MAISSDGHAQLMGDGGRGERVRHVVLTVQPHGHIAAPGGCVQRESGLSVLREPDILGTYVGVRRPRRRGARGPSVRDAMARTSGSSALSTASRRPRAERLDELALRLRDLLAAAELADVGGADVQHERRSRGGVSSVR